MKHNKAELTLVQIGSYLIIEESLRTQEIDSNNKVKNQVGSSFMNMVECDGSKNSKKSKNKRQYNLPTKSLKWYV